MAGDAPIVPIGPVVVTDPTMPTKPLTLNCRHYDQQPSAFSNDLGSYAGLPYFDLYDQNYNLVAQNLPCGTVIPEVGVSTVHWVFGYEAGISGVLAKQGVFPGVYNILMPDICGVPGLDCGSVYVECRGDEKTNMNFGIQYKTGPNAGQLVMDHVPCGPTSKLYQVVDNRQAYTVRAYQGETYWSVFSKDFDFTKANTATVTISFPFGYPAP